MLKFYLDEHVDHAIAVGLRRRGIEVITTAQAGLGGASDDEQLHYALSESRVIFTNDSDFLLYAVAGQKHAGIVYCAVGARSVGYVIEALAFLSAELQPDDMQGQVEFI